MNYPQQVPFASDPEVAPTAFRISGDGEIIYLNGNGERVYDPFDEYEQEWQEQLEYYQRFHTSDQFAEVVGIFDVHTLRRVMTGLARSVRQVVPEAANDATNEACRLRFRLADDVLYQIFLVEPDIPNLVTLLQRFCAFPEAPEECVEDFVAHLAGIQLRAERMRANFGLCALIAQEGAN